MGGMKFSLRTLFVLVTLCCVFLGWQWRIVHERRAVVQWLQSSYDYDEKRPAGAKIVICQEDGSQLSWLRRRFGDASYHWSCILPATEREQLRMFSAFPQAAIYVQEGRHLRPKKPAN